MRFLSVFEIQSVCLLQPSNRSEPQLERRFPRIQEALSFNLYQNTSFISIWLCVSLTLLFQCSRVRIPPILLIHPPPHPFSQNFLQKRVIYNSPMRCYLFYLLFSRRKIAFWFCLWPETHILSASSRRKLYFFWDTNERFLWHYQKKGKSLNSVRYRTLLEKELNPISRDCSCKIARVLTREQQLKSSEDEP